MGIEAKKWFTSGLIIEELGGRQKIESYLPQQEVYNHSVHAYSAPQLLAKIVYVIISFITFMKALCRQKINSLHETNNGVCRIL